MIKDIIKNVESPFSDELIHYLIKTYISCGCDDKLFYDRINNTQSINSKMDKNLIKLINELRSKGIDESEVFYCKDIKHIPFIYNSNDSWMTINSEEDPMKENVITKDKKAPLIYRIYINIKGKEKIEFIEEYINECSRKEIPFKFKFSKDNDRIDQIVILTSIENFEENISIVKELTKNVTLGNLPMLVGRYQENIGISEEYFNRLYSPTSVKLALIRSSVKKYICDHYNLIISQASIEEKKIIDEFIEEFKYIYEIQEQEVNDLGDDYYDFRKKYYKKKSTLNCAKEYIENDSDSYVCGIGLLNLGTFINKLYKSSKEDLILEITNNFKEIGREVWGFSENFIFSNETEKNYLNESRPKDIKTIYSVKNKIKHEIIKEDEMNQTYKNTKENGQRE